MEFQFGTNWAPFSVQAGALVGPPRAMEGIYAFFRESIFLSIFLLRPPLRFCELACAVSRAHPARRLTPARF